MVCKEELFLWFRSLKGSKRVEVMCGLLNMCYPLELRFYGTCLEDLGRRDFYTLRDEEVKSNNIAEVLKIKNVCDAFTRSKLIVVLSLLNSSNMVCSKELFKILTDEIKIESLSSSGILADSKIVDEFLLLLTIAQNHPAFTFEQQTFLGELCLFLENYSKELISRSKYESSMEDSPTSPVFPLMGCLSPVDAESWTNSHYQFGHHNTDLQPGQARITNLKVKAPHRKMCIRIRVAWDSNKITDAFKSPSDLTVFHQKLVQLFPVESQVPNQEKFIPALPHHVATWNKQHALTESIISSMTEYIQQLNVRLPGYVLESDFVTHFFSSSLHSRTVLSRGRGTESDNPPKNPRLRSLTIYNSHIAENSGKGRPEARGHKFPMARKLSENGSDLSVKTSSPFTSPLQSPLSSPYASPVNSEGNSRASSPWGGPPPPSLIPPPEMGFLEKFLVEERLHEHWDLLRNYRIEELQTMPVEELESLGILKDVITRLRKMLDSKSLPNGVSLKRGPVQLLVQESAESSPVCSEYSSPPQSPSPPSTNQSSSSNEDADKKLPTKLAAELSKIEESVPNTQETAFKRVEDEVGVLKGSRECLNRPSVSVLPFPIPYSSIITQLPPPQSVKPTYLPLPCRTNGAPQHMNSPAVVFDNQFSRVPLPSALTFMPPCRSHAVTPERTTPMPAGNMPICSVLPFPIVTSGGATAVPSSTCSITTLKSCNSTMVTNSSVAKPNQKASPPLRDMDGGTKLETPYATGYILAASTVACSCYSSTNAVRPSPAPSPSMSPSATPSAVPVSLPYLGMPYIFHHSIPFMQAQSAANGYVPPPGMASPSHAFSYALPNGLSTLPPELLYPGQTFSLQPPTSQGAVSQVAPPVSQCYGLIPQAAITVKLVSCYNCGKIGHRGPDCKDQNIDEMSKPGKFQLNYNPTPKLPENHE